MKAAEGRTGRVFVLQLDADDKLPGCVERFAAENGVLAAQVAIQTHSRPGSDSGGRMALGVLALDHQGHPALSLGGDCGEGQGDSTTRDVVIQEWLGLQVLRVDDPRTGAALLTPSIRPAGQTQVLQQHMLDLALARAAGHAAPPAPPTPPRAPSPPAPVADSRPSVPSTVAVYLSGARLN